MKIGEIKHSAKIGKLNYDNEYVLNNKGATLQDGLLNTVLGNEK